jgi:hypothetical protein
VSRAAAVLAGCAALAVWACSSEEAAIAPDPSGAGGASNASSTTSASVSSSTSTTSSSTSTSSSSTTTSTSSSTSTASTSTSTGEGGATTASSTTTGAGGTGGDGGTGGSAEVQGQGFVSGPRLRAKYYLGTDGSKQFHGWYDSQRQEDCFYVTATDGTRRCMPVDYSAKFGSYFADAACTQPLAVKVSACAVGKYATRTTAPDLCVHNAQNEVALVGPAFVGQIYLFDGAGCLPGGAQEPHTITVLAPTEFVEATVVVE